MRWRCETRQQKASRSRESPLLSEKEVKQEEEVIRLMARETTREKEEVRENFNLILSHSLRILLDQKKRRKRAKLQHCVSFI